MQAANFTRLTQAFRTRQRKRIRTLRLLLAAARRHSAGLLRYSRRQSGFSPLSVPDITGNVTDVAGGAGMSFNGRALTGDVTDNPRVFGTTGKGRFASITLQAKRSSDAYGNSTTVQPAALRLLAIVKF